MPEFKPLRGEIKLGENQFIRTAQSRGPLTQQQNDPNKLPVTRQNKSGKRRVVLIVGALALATAFVGTTGAVLSVVASLVNAFSSIILRVLPQPVPAPDPCADANVHFSWATNLGENSRNELIAKNESMRDHLAKFPRCSFATAANSTMSRLQERLYQSGNQASGNQASPPNWPAPPVIPTAERRKPKTPPAPSVPPIQRSAHRGMIAVGATVMVNSYLSAPLKLARGYTTSFVVHGEPVLLHKGDEISGPYMNGQRLPIFTNGYSIFKVTTYEGSSVLKLVEIKKVIMSLKDEDTIFSRIVLKEWMMRIRPVCSNC